MLWKYRTIVFELTKDGRLGDRYVDDEEMEKTLNEMGALGWELVNVTLLQDGLLAILKRPVGADTVAVGPAVRAAAVAEPVDEAMVEPDEEVEEVEEAPIMVTPFLRERPRPTTPAFRQPVSAMEMDDEDELPPLRGLEQQRQGGRERREPDFFDDIRIS